MDTIRTFIRKRIKEKYKTIDNFSKATGIPRTTVNFILKNGVGVSSYGVIGKILESLEIVIIDGMPFAADRNGKNLLKAYYLADEKGKADINSFVKEKFKRLSSYEDRPVIAAYGDISDNNYKISAEIMELVEKVREN